MTHVIAAIKDTKAEVFMPPYLYRTKADFIRTVQVEAKNPQSMLHKFPSDYELYIVGDWDEQTGIIPSDELRLGSVMDLCPLT